MVERVEDGRREALALEMLETAARIRSSSQREFGGSFLAGPIQEGMAKGFEDCAYNLAPHLKPPVGNHPIIAWVQRLRRTFVSGGNHPHD